MYQQNVLPSYLIPYVGGLCEGYIEGTVGQATLPTLKNPITSGVYPTATVAWDTNRGNHPNELPPKGMRVAVYFSLGNTSAGHTAIQLEDGRVATTPRPGYHPSPGIYPSLQAMIDDYSKHNNGCSYLGWTEYIGNVQVTKKGETMKEQDVANIVGEVWGIPANANNLRDYEGMEPVAFMYHILGVMTPWQDRKNRETLISQQNTELKAEIERLQNDLGSDFELVDKLYRKK